MVGKRYPDVAFLIYHSGFVPGNPEQAWDPAANRDGIDTLVRSLVDNGVAPFLFGVVLALAYAFVMSWVGVWLGLRLPSVEVAQQVSFIVILPLTFISGLLGMNVGGIPWAQSPAGFWAIVALCAAIVLVIWLYFRRSRWL